MYSLHVTGKTPFHFPNAVSSYTKYRPQTWFLNKRVLLPLAGNNVLRVAVGGSGFLL